MTYAAYETSIQSGRPVELYEFTRATQTWRYTSHDQDVTHGGETFTAKPMARSAIEATSEQARLPLDIDCAADLPLLDLFRVVPPDDVVLLTVRRLHQGDGNAVITWMGRVLSVGWQNSAQARIHCESVYSSLKRSGLRRMYQKQCPHVLYSAACGLDRAAWAEACAVADLDGVTLTVTGLDGFADGYFAGGYVEWTDPDGLVERRAIRAQAGGVLTLTFPMPALAAAVVGWGLNWGNYWGGRGVLVYTGCDHTLATCETKFGNSANYGGMPYIPSKNPFDGTPVY